MAVRRSQRSKRNSKQDAPYYSFLGEDKDGFAVKYIDSFKGRGVFSCQTFEKRDFLIEYRGEVITKRECENRLKVYHDALKVYIFDFRFNGQQLCVDAAKEDGSLGRLVNDNHVNPNSEMKIIRLDGKPHLCLFATKDISPGEEITYNYGDSHWPWRNKENQSQSVEVVTCHSLKESTEQMSTETHVEPPDSCSSIRDNSDKMSTETYVQPADVSSCISIRDNSDKMSTETHVQPAVVGSCSSIRDNSYKMSTETHVQPTDLDSCRSLRDHSDKLSTETHVQPAVVGSCSSIRDNSYKDCEHYLVSEDMPSLDKCVICRGPYAALKWIGERCKVCSKSWHKRCYVKNMKTTTVHLPEISEEQSSSEMTSSEEEYVPDTHSDSTGSAEEILELS
ncbi:unnamed protein product [Arctogadus glacialis]